jgi:hypothetical protein
MALTVTESTKFIAGDKKFVFANILFDATYPTGGEVVAASDFSSINAIDEIVIAQQDPDGATEVSWDKTEGKFLAFVASTAAQVANGTDPGIAELRVIVIGH